MKAQLSMVLYVRLLGCDEAKEAGRGLVITDLCLDESTIPLPFAVAQ